MLVSVQGQQRGKSVAPAEGTLGLRHAVTSSSSPPNPCSQFIPYIKPTPPESASPIVAAPPWSPSRPSPVPQPELTLKMYPCRAYNTTECISISHVWYVIYISIIYTSLHHTFNDREYICIWYTMHTRTSHIVYNTPLHHICNIWHISLYHMYDI